VNSQKNNYFTKLLNTLQHKMRVPLYIRHHHNKIHILLFCQLFVSNCEMKVYSSKLQAEYSSCSFTAIHVSNSNITVQWSMSFSYSRGPRPKPLPENRLSLTCSLDMESVISSGPNTGQYVELGYSLFTSCTSIRLHTICDPDNHGEYVRTYRGLLNILYLM